MDAQIKTLEGPGGSIVEVLPDQNLFGQGEEPNDLLGLAWGAEALGLLLHGSAFAPQFFDLKTGIAGEVLQKMVNYHCRAAFLIEDLEAYDIRVQELAHDHRRHPTVRFFSEKEAALDWLWST